MLVKHLVLAGALVFAGSTLAFSQDMHKDMHKDMRHAPMHHMPPPHHRRHKVWIKRHWDGHHHLIKAHFVWR